MTTLWVYSSSQWTQIRTHLLLNCYATLCSGKGGFPYVTGLGGGGGPGPAFPLLFYNTTPRRISTFWHPQGGYSRAFLVGMCRTVLQILTLYFRPKNVIFHTRFETSPLKSVPVFRPGLQEIMSPLLWLEQQRKRFDILRINMRIQNGFLLLSYSFGIETINTFIHSRSSLENHTRFQNKLGKVYTSFSAD